ncbi:hypothetical protein CAPTEDRAFT_225306 [Capitella teleta]|uniref:Uncharacterized protein n=1 Tax=Capitella teleta TaxID=283909 RepID=R7T9J4_CAPTE|nr:hypothetical protein CAPTEDRAFT_225306 [Capitella teleta]|eukprot:ELT90192.1 hypothetical protein CAPTEDRAFT_225306 [Capitella teleta]
MVVPPPSASGSPPRPPPVVTMRISVEQEEWWIKALRYVELLKVHLAKQPHIQAQFLEIAKELKSPRQQNEAIDYADILKRMKDLFKDHPQLIPGLEIFLPPGWRNAARRD